MLAQEGAADLTFSTLPGEVVGRVRAVDGIADARGVLLFITSAGSSPFFFFFFFWGVEPGPPGRDQLELLDGRFLEAGDTDGIVLGSRSARDLGASVGGTVTIAGRTFTVVGVYRSAVLWEDGGGFTPLPVVQEAAGEPGSVSVVFVTAELGTSLPDLADAVLA
jgi:hypothetical protein